MKLHVFVVALAVFVTFCQSQIIPGCPGCSLNGVCYNPNQEWRQGCWTKKCEMYPHRMGWRTVIVKTQCPDTYGRCVDHGKKMSDERCYCKVTGHRWSLVCQGK